MNQEASLPRWLIVVRRERHDLYTNLRQSFESDPQVEVILDRRQTGRSAEDTAGQNDAGRRQRRKSRTDKDRALWESAGFELIHMDEELEVYETTDAPSRTKAADRARKGRGGDRPRQADRDEEIRRHLETALRLLGG